MINYSKKRVALIGNMNNNFFSLLRYLLDRNIDAYLLLFNNELDQFQPESDTWFIEKYKKRIVKINIGNPFSELHKKKKIQKIFSRYDMFIGCGYAPYYASLCKIKLDIFIPYGSDLYELPFNTRFEQQLSKPAKGFFKSLLLYTLNLFVSYHQQKGIRDAKFVITTNILPTFRDAIKKLEISVLDVGVPIVYNEEINCLDKLSLSFIENIKKISDHDFVICSQSRQYWYTLIDTAQIDNLKRNDLLIKGFAKFLKQTNAKARLLLFEYGPDVKYSKLLIENEQIKDRVIWFGKTTRKEILYLFSKYVHIGADQFLSGYFGGTGYEILSQGKPLMTTITLSNNEYTVQTGKSFPPIINVSSENEIADKLQYYYYNREKLNDLSKDSLDWFEANLGNKLADFFVKKFFEKI